MSEPTKVCLATTDADLKCYSSEAEAAAAKAGSPCSRSRAPRRPRRSRPRPSRAPRRRRARRRRHRRTASPTSPQNELHCYPTQAQAEAARKAITTTTTQTTWCIAPADATESDRQRHPDAECLGLAVTVGLGLAHPDAAARVRPAGRSGAPAPAVRLRHEADRAGRAGRVRGRPRDDAVLRRELAERRARLLHDAGRRRREAARDRPAAPAGHHREDRAPRGTGRRSRSSRRAIRSTTRSSCTCQTAAEQATKACLARRAGHQHGLVPGQAEGQGPARAGHHHRQRHHEGLRAAEQRPEHRCHAMGRDVPAQRHGLRELREGDAGRAERASRPRTRSRSPWTARSSRTRS